MRFLKYCSLSDAVSPLSLDGKSPREYSLEIISNNRLYFADPAQLNDPFDCNIPFDLNNSEMDSFLRDALLQMQENIEGIELRKIIKMALENKAMFEALLNNWTWRQRIYGFIYNKMGVISLCRAESRNHPLMWAHYANSHDGICYEFEEEASWVDLKQDVDYSPGFDKFNIAGSDPMRLIKAIRTKGPEWAYEHECRLIKANAARTYLTFAKESLKAIYFGLKINVESYYKIAVMIESLGFGCPIFQMELSTNSYELYARSIDKLGALPDAFVRHLKESKPSQ
jgi:hypothetical protein